MKIRLLCVACCMVLLACGNKNDGAQPEAERSSVVQPAASQVSISNTAQHSGKLDNLQVRGFSLGMDIQGVPDVMISLLADQHLSGFGFTGVIGLDNKDQCVLMYTKPFLQALEERARDRNGAARAQVMVDQEMLSACENSDGVMTVHAGPDGRVSRIQFNDARDLFSAQDMSPAEFADHLAAEMQIPSLKPDNANSTWNYSSPQGTNISIETKNPLGISLLRVILSRSES